MSEALILSLDNGTQSVRALVYNRKGDLLYKHKIELEAYFSRQPGWAEQEADYYWDNVCKACQAVLQQMGSDKNNIAALTLTTQRGTTVNLDRQGQPLRPAVTWLDQRLAEPLSPMPWYWNGLFKLAGQQDAVKRFRQHVDANWQKINEPDLWGKTDKVLLLSGYLNYKLVGNYIDSQASQVGYLPFDYKKQRWASKLDWKWAATGMHKQQLPKLLKPGQLLGELTPQAAEQTGLPCGLKVIAAAADKACEIIGSGCISPEMGAISYGTTATVNAVSEKYIEALPLMPPYPAAIPDAFCTEIQIFRGFWMVSWFLQQFGLSEVQQAKKLGVAPEVLCDELIQSVPAGSMGLMVQPYWTPGVKLPGPEAKGAIIGFGDVHTKAHIYRAIIEGLAYAVREAKERIEKRTKTPMQCLRISGGGSQSDNVMQITADVMGFRVERPKTYETSGLGAAMTAAVGLGWYTSVSEAAKAMGGVGNVFEPFAKNQKIYNDIYQDVYLKMYARLRPLYRKISNITRYPDLS